MTVPPLLPPRFRPVRPLGSGGQADVWLAHDTEIDQPVAVKLFRPDADGVARERLRREVRFGRTLQHPRLVRLFELIDAGDRPAVVMEWVPGGSLADRLANGRLPLREVLRAGEETLDALAYLHGKGVLHRDVKPSNLLLDASGGALLADLGLARPEGDDAGLTRTSITVGTPGFLSPEQIQGREPGPPSDLYALGVTLFHLLTGEPPFRGASGFEIASRHLSTPPPSPARIRPDCPAWLATFVLRLLEKRPGDRFASGAEALEAFRRAAPGSSPRVRRRRLRAAALLVALVAAGALAWKPVRALLGPPFAQKFVADGTGVRGLAADGRTLWTADLGIRVTDVLDADLDGDGHNEAVVSATAARDDDPRTEAAVLDGHGRFRARIRPDDVIAEWPFQASRSFSSGIDLGDLSGDGLPEVLIRFTSRPSFPSFLVVFWPALAHREAVFFHAGHLQEVWLVPGARPARLRIVAAGNRMGHVMSAAELEVAPPLGRRSDGRPVWVFPGHAVDSDYDGVALRWYTPMAETSLHLGSRLGMKPDGTTTFQTLELSLEVDPLGNPVPGPNAGRDLRAERVSLIAGISALHGVDAPASTADVAAEAARIEARCRNILAELASRSALSIHVARAYGRIGAPERGTRVLTPLSRSFPSQDVLFQLANLLALSGDVPGARLVAEKLVADHRGGHATYDGLLLLMALQTEMRDAAAYRDSVSRFTSFSEQDHELDRLTLLARDHLLRDRVEQEDTRAAWSGRLAWGNSLPVLARWRLGQTRPDDALRMAEGAAVHLESPLEHGLARAAALLGTGQAAEALAELDGTIARSRRDAAEDFRTSQMMRVVNALRTRALLETGQVDAAVREARALRPGFPEGFLPRALVEEVLRDATSSRRENPSH